jgi:glyoxylase-like metal-dependent hydrolase (beta-lactamase superfamily II)
LFVFDPIPLAASARDQLLARGPLAAIVLTNANHERAAAEWRVRTGAPLWAAAEAALETPRVQRFDSTARTWESWEIHPLPGGAPGEIALRREELSLVVLGDAVFDLPQYGFGVLPEKYCSDRARLLAALRGLVSRPFARAALAHGGPLPAGASRHIAGLLPLES